MSYSIKKLTQKNFPASLSQIPQPPKQLYLAGEIPDWTNTKFITVIGSRKYTNYGKEICEKIISELSGFNVTIVSGLAIGIDSIAHQSALKNNLKTIAIPGSGLDKKVIYPSLNKKLAQEIINSGGCLLSEFESDFQATAWSFPKRNRIMAGLADIILVIEAEEKSGTLITARMGLDYNKIICAIPASIFSHNSIGSNRLLKQGATPITCGNDILEIFGYYAENKKIDTTDCSTIEKKILEILKEPLTKDEIIRNLKIPAQEINAILSLMELKNLITENFGEFRVL